MPFSCQSLRSAEWLEAKSVELQQAEQCTPFSKFVIPPVVRAGTMVLPCLSHATHMPFSCLLGAAFLPVLKFCGYDHKLVAGPGPLMVEQSTVKKTRGNLGKTRKKMAWMGLPIEMIQIEIAHLLKGMPLSCGL